MNPITRGMRNAFRNSIRTFSIVAILGASIALAIIMLLARQAVESKIESVKSSVGNTITVSPAGARGFEGGGNPLTTSQMDQLKSLDHVTRVTESLNDRLNSDNTNLQSAIDAGSIGRRAKDTQQGGGGNVQIFGGSKDGSGETFKPPIEVVGTNDVTNLQAAGRNIKITDGKAFDPSKDANVAVIGKALADKNNLKVGSTFTAYNTTITVVGIFDGGNANKFASSLLVMPLPTVQKLSEQSGAISSAAVQIDSISNLASTTKAVSDKLGSTADVTSDETAAEQTVQPLESIKNTTLISLIGAVIAGSAVILLTMVMIVRERRREVGVLKAIGATNRKIVAQFMAEAVTLTLLASVIGLGLGVLGANPITKSLVTNSINSQTQDGQPTGMPTMMKSEGGMGRQFGGGFRQAFNAPTKIRKIGSVNVAIGWQTVAFGVGAALVIALLGSAIPAWLIAKIRPAEVMRAE